MLIIETVQMGGSLVFLKDHAPGDIDQWLKPLYSLFLGDIPFVQRHSQDLISGRFETKAQDLIFFFSSQIESLESLDSVLQGQRLWLSESGNCDADLPVDYIWSSCSLNSWTQSFEEMKSLWDEKEKIDDIGGSHQAPCLFLDRDDVVVKNVPYNKDPDQVELMPGIESLISRAHCHGFWVALVTNQSGLGRGWVSWSEYQQVHQRMLELLAQKGSWLDECVWAGYIEQDGLSQGRLLASQRKPRVGMFQMVNSKLKVDMANSVMVGDSASDLIAAFSVGIKNLFLLSSEKLEKEKQKLSLFQQSHLNFHYNVAPQLTDVHL